jgi:hypothetical protein
VFLGSSFGWSSLFSFICLRAFVMPGMKQSEQSAM